MTSTGRLHLYLIRHGETAWNVEKRLQGSLEPGPGLTAKGRQQARCVGRVYDAFDAIYTSPLLRCVESVEEIARGVQVSRQQTIENLKERSLGAHEGKVLDRDVLRAIRSGVGVETFEELKVRSRKTLESIARDAIRHGHLKIMVMTHGGLASACASWMAPNKKLNSMNNCGVSTVGVMYNQHGYVGWEIEAWNAVSHLHDDTVQATNNFGGGEFG